MKKELHFLEKKYQIYKQHGGTNIYITSKCLINNKNKCFVS